MLNDRNFDCAYGVAEQVSPLIRRVVARNPGPFTFLGTGTYIVGRGRVAVIDPGPDLSDHVEALLAALAGETVSQILITHTHIDHSPAAAALKAATGAPCLGFGPHGARGETGEAGADLAFDPDIRMADGDELSGEGWTLTALHTPGHASNHLCFALAEEQALFSGDQVMGWSTTVDQARRTATWRLTWPPSIACWRAGTRSTGRPMAARSAIRRPMSPSSSPIAGPGARPFLRHWSPGLRGRPTSSPRSISAWIRAWSKPRRNRYAPI